MRTYNIEPHNENQSMNCSVKWKGTKAGAVREAKLVAKELAGILVGCSITCVVTEVGLPEEDGGSAMSQTYELLRPMSFYGGVVYEPGTLVTDLGAPFVAEFKEWSLGSFRESLYAGLKPVQHGKHWFVCDPADLLPVPPAIDFKI